ncbi:hypothetical protein CU668_02680 [Pseudomonas syringae pv. actinidifoliorum]|nr:hypothetical protein [Pseudomonas syringae pv. actinidifoliorum]
MSGILAATLRWVLKPQALQVKLEDLWIVVDVGIPGRAVHGLGHGAVVVEGFGFTRLKGLWVVRQSLIG